jgi:RNA methyltransferase, TrmH family
MQSGYLMKHEVTSAHNPKIKRALNLKERRGRDETGLFLIEGYRELKRALDSGVTIQRLFFSPSFFLGVNEDDLLEQAQSMGAELYKCPPSLFEKLSYRDRPDGLIGVAVQMNHSLPALMAQLKKEPLLVVAEAVEKPGNLGTILRSADAAGADGVIVSDRCTDIYNPNVVRASVGTLFTRPIVEATGGEIVQMLRRKKIKVVAATPSAPQTFTDANLLGPIAIVVGTEQLGLSDPWLQVADIKVSIPMHGVADSLNVAVATTLLLYEVLRQRKGPLLWK